MISESISSKLFKFNELSNEFKSSTNFFIGDSSLSLLDDEG